MQFFYGATRKVLVYRKRFKKMHKYFHRKGSYEKLGDNMHVFTFI